MPIPLKMDWVWNSICKVFIWCLSLCLGLGEGVLFHIPFLLATDVKWSFTEVKVLTSYSAQGLCFLQTRCLLLLFPSLSHFYCRAMSSTNDYREVDKQKLYWTEVLESVEMSLRVCVKEETEEVGFEIWAFKWTLNSFKTDRCGSGLRCVLKAWSHNSIPASLSYLESDGILTDMQSDVLSLEWLHKSFMVELGNSISQTVTLFHSDSLAASF